MSFFFFPPACSLYLVVFYTCPAPQLINPLGKLQSRFGRKPLKFQALCPQNGTAVQSMPIIIPLKCDVNTNNNSSSSDDMDEPKRPRASQTCACWGWYGIIFMKRWEGRGHTAVPGAYIRKWVGHALSHVLQLTCRANSLQQHQHQQRPPTQTVAAVEVAFAFSRRPRQRQQQQQQPQRPQRKNHKKKMMMMMLAGRQEKTPPGRFPRPLAVEQRRRWHPRAPRTHGPEKSQRKAGPGPTGGRWPRGALTRDVSE